MGSPKDFKGGSLSPSLNPSSTMPSEVIPTQLSASDRVPIARPGAGIEGRQILLHSNQFTAKIKSHNVVFYQYNVSIKSDDDHEVGGRGFGWKIMNKLYDTYSSDLAKKAYAYDGEKSLFTVGPLPENQYEFSVFMEYSSARHIRKDFEEGGDYKRAKHIHCVKKFKVVIKYAATFPLSPIIYASEGIETGNTQNTVRILNIILRHQQAKRGCLLVRQSFFNDDRENFIPLGGGVSGCLGFHSSFQTTQSGLILNMDVSTTLVMTPGPVIDFLLANQNIRDPRQIDWAKAKWMLKNMRIKCKHNKLEFKIIGFSEFTCNQQLFSMNVSDEDGQVSMKEITVYDYYTNKRKLELTWSAFLPCLTVGKPKKPIYLPIELCELISLQRYTKALSALQRASLVEKSRKRPEERIRVVADALSENRYDEDPMLSACGISIEKQLVQFNGRVLNPPKLKVGKKEDCIPNNGRWNFNNKTLWNPITIEKWAIVNFSAQCDISHLSRELINCGRKKGIMIERPVTLIEEDSQARKSGPVERVEQMFERVKLKIPGTKPPQFLLCVLPERKICDIYGPWKKKNLHEVGIVTQCIAPKKITDQYLTNVLLKINSKLGGINSLLEIEHLRGIPHVTNVPTLILGMDVSHSPPGRADIPSIAAVVGSRCWPLISRYRACVRSQPSKTEIIESLYKPSLSGEDDDGIIRELMLDFYQSSGQQKPRQIIIFRDGVGESQFNQVLNIELGQIIKAIENLGVETFPRFTVIITQKRHHTKLFRVDSPENVPAGTVVDSMIVHPKNYDFYMCAHSGMMGTSRPTRYQVLLDEIGFKSDDLQKLIHSLSYVYQRSTSAISIVAPVAYAHLAASQISQFVKFNDYYSDTPSGDRQGRDIPPPFQVLPRLHENVESSMFFC
ncbi:Protein argonaute 16 [Zostera marina]|uniref:Protein argonaute 16 n=1 Tax=Zostera marina TaxID=29655 RepID=A0A0K9PLC3_ZOSMR|nr:Protein argonaute 16 [Zostera marina]